MPRPAMLTPELLNTFITLLKHGGDASSAGATLGINQPSMSKRLAYFQHSGKVIRRPWLERHGKTWVATEEGLRVLPVVEDLLRRYEHMLAFVEGGRPPGLTVACGKESAQSIVLVALKRFRKKHPDTPFRISQLRGRQRVEGVANGLLSLALVTHDRAQIETYARHRPLHIEELLDDPLVLACAARSDWARGFQSLKAPVDATALASFPLVLPEPDSGLREQLERKLTEAGQNRPLSVALEVGGWATLLKYIEAGLGIGPLPRSLASKSKGLLVLEAAPGLLPANSVRLICRQRHGGEGLDLGEMEQAFLDLLREAAREP